MSGDTTYQALERLTAMPDRADPQGDRIAGQYVYDVNFTGGNAANMTLTNVTINGETTSPTTRIITDPGNYTALDSDYTIVIERNTPETASIILLASPGTAGRTIVIKDGSGNFDTYPQTVDGNGNNIDGASTLVLATDWESVTLRWDGVKWENLSIVPGSGTVTSVAMTGDNVIFNTAVTGSPITSSGTLVPSLKTHAANLVLAGPATGSAAAPTFRALVASDLPAGIVTSVSGTTNRITSTGGATPVIDISASYVGQSSLTTLGTITTGVWNAGAVTSSGGVQGTQLTSTVATGTAPLVVASTTLVANLHAATADSASAVAVGNITGLGTGVATWLATPSSANLAAAVSDETGSGALVFGTSPTVTGISSNLYTVTGASAPTNGMYLPTTNTLGFSTNSIEAINIDASQRTQFGSYANFALASGFSPNVEILGTTANTSALGVGRFSADTSAPALRFYKGRGAVGSHTALNSNDSTMRIISYGDDGTAGIENARIESFAVGSVSTGIVPGQLNMSTNNSSGVSTTALTIDSAQLATFSAGVTANVFTGAGTGLTGTAASLTAGAVAVGGITGLGTGVSTFLATPTSGNLATALTTAGAGGIYAVPAYKVGKSYLHGVIGSGPASTNTTTQASDTVYAVQGIAFAPLTISTISLRTSSSNTSVGASVKVAVYGALSTGLPGARLGNTAVGTAITDAAVSTVFTITLDAPAVVPAGPFFIAVLCTFVTTAVRLSIYSNQVPQGVSLGSSTIANLFSATPDMGYFVAQSYATGMPSPFGSPGGTLNNIATTPVFVFTAA